MKKFYAFAAAALFAVAANAQTLYITGAGEFVNGEWNAETPDEFVMENGEYVAEINGLTQFKISTAAGDWDSFNAGCYGCAYGDQPGVTVALEAGNDGNIVCPWEGDYKIVVSGDLSTITLTTDTPKPTGETPIYLRGDMNGWLNDGFVPEWQLEKVGENVWKFVCGDDQKIGLGEAFKVADQKWNTYNYGGSGEAVDLELAYEVYYNASANLTLAEEWNGVLWMVLDLDGANYIELSNDKDYVPEWYDGSAVEEVAVEEGEAVYYTLQGVKVANPANGIYVVVKGGKAVKAVVK